MLQAMHTGFWGLLHLPGHSQPPEMFLQQGQGSSMPLIACILVAPIQGGNTLCLGDHKEKEIGLTLGP